MITATNAFPKPVIFLIILSLTGYAFAQNTSAGDSSPNHLVYELNSAFVSIARQTTPAVVSVQAFRTIPSDNVDTEGVGKLFRFKSPPEQYQKGSGSGIIVAENGFILTNVHVVEHARELRVILPDNRAYKASIVGLDPLTEVAVIKIDASGLPKAKLGDSDSVKVGQWVLAIGNPLDLRSSVTAGIVSAVERKIDIIHDVFSIETFIQTDAAINPGNSGGALVNINGEVIGVNTAIATDTGYNAGFGFAIPINLARKVMKDLIEFRRVERAFLGIAMKNMNETIARAFHLSMPVGVFVDDVLENSPAMKFGIHPMDILLEVDGLPVSKSNQIQSAIAQKNPGDEMTVKLLRDGKPEKLDLILGRRDADVVAMNETSHLPKTGGLGLQVAEISSQVRRDLGLSAIQGVVVTYVEQWSLAEESDIKTDDIITQIDGKVISNAQDFVAAMAGAKSGSVSVLTVYRRAERTHVFVENK